MSKMVKGALIVILLFSALNVAPVMAKCPTCQGTEKVVCPHCDGDALVLKPTINAYWKSHAREGKVIVDAVFENAEDVGVYGTPIAEVEGMSRTYTNSSPRTYFPPHEKIGIAIIIEGIHLIDYSYFSGLQYISAHVTVSEVDSTTCPVCDGTGFVTCPECGGALIDVGG